MYSEIETEFAPKFEGTTLNFQTEYDYAMGRVKHYNNDEVIKNAIKSILSEVLAEYSRTKATTKVGRILRFISRIFAPIVKVFK